MANINIPERSVRQQIASAITVVVQLSRMSDGTRKCTNISEITGLEENIVSMSDIFNFVRRGIGPDGRVVGTFQPTGIRPRFLDRLRVAGIQLPAEIFQRRRGGMSGSMIPVDIGGVSGGLRPRGGGHRGDEPGPFEAREAAPAGFAMGNGAHSVRGDRCVRATDIRREEHARQNCLARTAGWSKSTSPPRIATAALSGGCEHTAGAPVAVLIGGWVAAACVIYLRTGSAWPASLLVRGRYPGSVDLRVSQADEAFGEIRTAASRSARHAGGRAEGRAQPDHGNRRVGPGCRRSRWPGNSGNCSMNKTSASIRTPP